MYKEEKAKDGKQKKDGRSMKIVILEDYALTPGDLDWSPLYELDAEIERYRRTTQEQAPGRIADAEYVIVNKVWISDEIL